MRIVLVTDTYHPSGSGAVVFTDTLAHELKARGHFVTIFAHSAKGGFHLEERAGIPVYRFPSFQSPFRVDARLPLPAPIQLRAALEAIRPDVVHMQSVVGLATATQRIARKLGIPVVATHHFSYDFIFAYLKPLQFLSSITAPALTAYLDSVYEKCAAVTCPTASIQRELQEAGLQRELLVISNGIDTKRYKPQKPSAPLRAHILPGLPDDAQVIVTMGRMDKDKRTDLILRAFALVREKVPKSHLLAVGSGNQLASLRELAKDLGIDKHITFAGKVKHDSLQQPKIFHLADVFAISSPIDTQSLATLEAVASGLPVVAVQAGALPELAQDGKNGFAVPFEDVPAFAAALCTILSDTKLRSQFAEASVAIAEPHALPKTIDAFISLYESVAAAS